MWPDWLSTSCSPRAAPRQLAPGLAHDSTGVARLMETIEEKGGQPRLLLALVIAAILIPAALGSSATIFNDGDVSWHIATGQWILDHRAIPHTDPFSFTWAGQPWVPFEWLADVLLAAAYRLAGY